MAASLGGAVTAPATTFSTMPIGVPLECAAFPHLGAPPCAIARPTGFAGGV